MARRTQMRFRMNRRGIGELLKSAGVVADVQRRAEAVVSSANALAGVEGGHNVRNATTNRARAIVMTSGKAAAEAEAVNHSLTAAVNAARR